MSVYEDLDLSFSVEDVNGNIFAQLYPAIAESDAYDEQVNGGFELPSDAVFVDIPQVQIATVTMALVIMDQACTVRLNDDANILVPCADFWIYRSAEDLTKLEIRNDGGSEANIRYFLLGT